MRNFFCFLLIFCATISLAENKQFSVKFDFTNPIALTPSIYPGVNEGDQVSITDTTFYEGSATLSFEYGNFSAGATILTGNSHNYSLYISKTTKVILSSTDFITSIKFNGNNIGDVLLSSSDGVFDRSISTWYDKSTVPLVHEVVFYIEGDSWPDLSDIEVTYVKCMDSLVPNSISIADSSKIYSFKDFTLTMSQELEKTNAEKDVTIKGRKTPQQSMSASVLGKNVTFSVPTLIETFDTLDINIPAGSIIAKDGTYNQELKYTFVLIRQEDSYTYTAIDPEPDSKIETLQTIKMSFPNTCHIDLGDNVIRVYQNGLPYDQMKLTKTGRNTVEMSTEYPCDEPAIYEVKVPKAVIYDYLYDESKEDKGLSNNMTYNPEMTLTYIVGNYMTPEEIQARKDSVLAEISVKDSIITIAKTYLEHVGAGYPSATSTGRTNLQSLVDKYAVQDSYDVDINKVQNSIDSVNAIKDSIIAAIPMYIAESEVEMPDTTKYYTIANVAKDGSKLYLAYNNGAITLSEKATDAQSFYVGKNADKYYFMTPDSAYLQILKPDTEEGAKYLSTTSKSVTAEYSSDINDMSISKLNVDSVAVEKLFGLLSVHGFIGSVQTGAISFTPKYGYAKVNTAEKVAMIDTQDKTVFTDSISTAFAIEEAKKPEDIIPEVSYTLNPANGQKIENLTYVSITFDNLDSVNCVVDSIKLMKVGSMDIIVPVAIDTINGGKHYNFYFSNIEAGNYVITFPEGTFTYKYKDSIVAVPAITSSYTVTVGYDFNYLFNVRIWDEATHSYIGKGNENTIVVHLGSRRGTDTEIALESIGIYGLTFYNAHFWVDSTKTVTIYDPTTKTTMCSGHFDVKHQEDYLVDGTKVTNYDFNYLINNDSIYTSTVWFKPDTEIDYSKFIYDTYMYVVPRGTFGDANFGRYLHNHSSVLKSECYVNEDMVSYVYIDPNKKPELEGDVNGDNVVDISDVNAIISIICGESENEKADVNYDGAIDISDVNAVICIICGQ